MFVNTISIVGLGYIGLPTAAMFASKKINVIGVDVDEKIVNTINSGNIHIVEPELDILVERSVHDGFLKAVLSPEEADVFFIAVPTPFSKTKFKDEVPNPDLSYVESASRAIAKVLKKGDLIILESTSPVGTTEKMIEWLEEERDDLTFPLKNGESSDIRVAYCPERVLPGSVIKELASNDRVIGGITNNCSEAAAEVYRVFVTGNCITTNARTAEMVKLTENASRDVNIAFANELSVICDSLDIDTWELIALANRHPRVNILQPGPGVGGHCIAVDPWFIVSQSPDEARLISMARKINDAKPDWVIEKVKLAIADFLLANRDLSSSDITIACYGLSFKPNIDDLRESPAVLIAKKILEIHSGLTLLIEPHLDVLPSSLGGKKCYDCKKALSEADIHLLLVDHDVFMSNRPSGGIVIDTRGIWTESND